jgi:hypothetical protein
VPSRIGEEKRSPLSSLFGVGVMVPDLGRSGDLSGDRLPSR